MYDLVVDEPAPPPWSAASIAAFPSPPENRPATRHRAAVPWSAASIAALDLNCLDIEYPAAFTGQGLQRWGSVWLGKERKRNGSATGCDRGFAGPRLRGWRGLLSGLERRYGREPRTRRRAGGGDRLRVAGMTHVRV